MTSTIVDVVDGIDARVLLGVLAQVNEDDFHDVMPIMGRSIQ